MPRLDVRFMPGRLFIGGVPSESDVSDIISRIGRQPGTRVIASEVVRDVVSHEFKGFAYIDVEIDGGVTTATATDAAPQRKLTRRNRDTADVPEDGLTRVISQLHGLVWKGAKLRVERARENFSAKLARQRAADSDAATQQAAATALAAAALAPTELPVQTGTVRVRRRKNEPLVSVPLQPLEAEALPPVAGVKRARPRTATHLRVSDDGPHKSVCPVSSWSDMPASSSSYSRGALAALATLQPLAAADNDGEDSADSDSGDYSDCGSDDASEVAGDAGVEGDVVRGQVPQQQPCDGDSYAASCEESSGGSCSSRPTPAIVEDRTEMLLDQQDAAVTGQVAAAEEQGAGRGESADDSADDALEEADDSESLHLDETDEAGGEGMESVDESDEGGSTRGSSLSDSLSSRRSGSSASPFDAPTAADIGGSGGFAFSRGAPGGARALKRRAPPQAEAARAAAEEEDDEPAPPPGASAWAMAMAKATQPHDTASRPAVAARDDAVGKAQPPQQRKQPAAAPARGGDESDDEGSSSSGSSWDGGGIDIAAAMASLAPQVPAGMLYHDRKRMGGWVAAAGGVAPLSAAAAALPRGAAGSAAAADAPQRARKPRARAAQQAGAADSAAPADASTAGIGAAPPAAAPAPAPVAAVVAAAAPAVDTGAQASGVSQEEGGGRAAQRTVDSATVPSASTVTSSPVPPSPAAAAAAEGGEEAAAARARTLAAIAEMARLLGDDAASGILAAVDKVAAASVASPSVSQARGSGMEARGTGDAPLSAAAAPVVAAAAQAASTRAPEQKGTPSAAEARRQQRQERLIKAAHAAMGTKPAPPLQDTQPAPAVAATDASTTATAVPARVDQPQPPLQAQPASGKRKREKLGRTADPAPAPANAPAPLAAHLPEKGSAGTGPVADAPPPVCEIRRPWRALVYGAGPADRAAAAAAARDADAAARGLVPFPLAAVAAGASGGGAAGAQGGASHMLAPFTGPRAVHRDAGFKMSALFEQQPQDEAAAPTAPAAGDGAGAGGGFSFGFDMSEEQWQPEGEDSRAGTGGGGHETAVTQAQPRPRTRVPAAASASAPAAPYSAGQSRAGGGRTAPPRHSTHASVSTRPPIDAYAAALSFGAPQRGGAAAAPAAVGAGVLDRGSSGGRAGKLQGGYRLKHKRAMKGALGPGRSGARR